jgi:hypothetical protein
MLPNPIGERFFGRPSIGEGHDLGHNLSFTR